MKYLIATFVLLVFTVIAFPLLLMSGDTSKDFIGQTDYYIGLQRPDGTCETVEVYATDFRQAERIVRDKYCEDCTLSDLTPNFASGGDGVFFASTAKLCPLIN